MSPLSYAPLRKNEKGSSARRMVSRLGYELRREGVTL
jgi:hypothetical protein